MIIQENEQLKKFCTDGRKWQGIPGIEITKKGRIFATFYSGGVREEFGNYCVILKSDDDGENFSEPIAVAYAGENFRTYDPCLWIDPQGHLWFIFACMPNHAVYASICENPDAENLVFEEARIIGHDVMMNKPIVLKNGDWLFPIAVWKDGIKVMDDCQTTQKERLSFVYKSSDCGKTFKKLGGADVPERSYDEHMVLEKNDGSILMFVRTLYGIGKSVSHDSGITWSLGENSRITGPNSRFHLKRLKSGNVLLVNHFNFNGRNNLYALISDNDCESFNYSLLLDERKDVSYPDAVECENGFIYVIYDRERGGFLKTDEERNKCAREILFAKITEQDILLGEIKNKDSKLKNIVSKL